MIEASAENSFLSSFHFCLLIVSLRVYGISPKGSSSIFVDIWYPSHFNWATYVSVFLVSALRFCLNGNKLSWNVALICSLFLLCLWNRFVSSSSDHPFYCCFSWQVNWPWYLLAKICTFYLMLIKSIGYSQKSRFSNPMANNLFTFLSIILKKVLFVRDFSSHRFDFFQSSLTRSLNSALCCFQLWLSFFIVDQKGSAIGNKREKNYRSFWNETI